MIIFYLSFSYSFKATNSYRIKLSGDKELYLGLVKQSVRMIPISTVNDMNLITEAEISDANSTKIRFCDKYLRAKLGDPGVISSDNPEGLVSWRLEKRDNGYRIVNQNGKCLTMLDKLDDSGDGYYLNTQNCDDNYNNEFSILDAGYSANFCKNKAKELCKEMGYKRDKRMRDDQYEPRNYRKRKDFDGNDAPPRNRQGGNRFDPDNDYGENDRPPPPNHRNRNGRRPNTNEGNHPRNSYQGDPDFYDNQRGTEPNRQGGKHPRNRFQDDDFYDNKRGPNSNRKPRKVNVDGNRNHKNRNRNDPYYDDLDASSVIIDDESDIGKTHHFPNTEHKYHHH